MLFVYWDDFICFKNYEIFNGFSNFEFFNASFEVKIQNLAVIYEFSQIFICHIVDYPHYSLITPITTKSLHLRSLHLNISLHIVTADYWLSLNID